MSRTKKISPEDAFAYWYQFGSLATAVRVYNKDTGSDISITGMHYAKDSWIMENPEKAKALIFPDRVPKKYKFDWKLYLLRCLMNRYRRANTMGKGRSYAFHKWIVRLGLEEYQHVYADQFGETFGRKRSKRMRSQDIPL